jgi:hypothetical protein
VDERSAGVPLIATPASPAPRTAYARVYVTTKGDEANDIWGYILVENVDRRSRSHAFKVAGGALLKPVTIVPFRYLSKDWADYNQMYDPKTDLTPADKQHIIDFAISSQRVGPGIRGEDRRLSRPRRVQAHSRRRLDGQSGQRVGTGAELLRPLQSDDHVRVFLPWDQDHSFGQFVPWRTAESQQQLDILHPWINRFEGAPFAAQLEHNLLARTFKLESFKRRYLSELATLTRTLTRPDRIAKQVDDLIPVIGPLVAEEPKDGRVISFNEAVHEGTFKRPFNQNSGAVNPIKVFVPIRQASVLAQLSARISRTASQRRDRATRRRNPELGPGATP